MRKDTLNKRINSLFQQNAWKEARKLLEIEHEKDSEDHWVVTQLGVTFYEEKKYRDALQLFRKSLEIVNDCPLTRWNLAGALDAVGDQSGAKEIYIWLLRAKTSPEHDPCWESPEWADAIKHDAVFRLGACLQSLGEKKKAETCYRRYLDLLLAGGNGMYSAEDVTAKIRSLHNGERGVRRASFKKLSNG